MLDKSSHTKIKLTLITTTSLVMAWAHWSVAKNQLTTIGFAASNRSPNHLAHIIGWLLAFAALVNIVFAFKAKRFGTSTMILVILIMALPILYFLSW